MVEALRYMPANPAWPLVACASKPGMPFGGMSANKPSRAIVICTDNSKYLLLISETHIYQCVLMFRAEDVSMSQILGCFFFLSFFLYPMIYSTCFILITFWIGVNQHLSVLCSITGYCYKMSHHWYATNITQTFAIWKTKFP